MKLFLGLVEVVLFAAWSQTCWQERYMRDYIYYNQTRVWSELKEDVRMEFRLNVAWVTLMYLFEGHLDLEGGERRPWLPSLLFLSTPLLWSSMGRAWHLQRCGYGLDSCWGSSNWNCVFAQFWETSNKKYPPNCLWCIGALWGEESPKIN